MVMACYGMLWPILPIKNGDFPWRLPPGNPGSPGTSPEAPRVGSLCRADQRFTVTPSDWLSHSMSWYYKNYKYYMVFDGI